MAEAPHPRRRAEASPVAASEGQGRGPESIGQRRLYQQNCPKERGAGAEGVRHKASVSDCLPLAAPIGLLPLLILTLCGPERVLVVSTEPPDDLSCLTTPGVGRPGDGAVAGGGGGANPLLLRCTAILILPCPTTRGFHPRQPVPDPRPSAPHFPRSPSRGAVGAPPKAGWAAWCPSHTPHPGIGTHGLGGGHGPGRILRPLQRGLPARDWAAPGPARPCGPPPPSGPFLRRQLDLNGAPRRRPGGRRWAWTPRVPDWGCPFEAPPPPPPDTQMR